MRNKEQLNYTNTVEADTVRDRDHPWKISTEQ